MTFRTIASTLIVALMASTTSTPAWAQDGMSGAGQQEMTRRPATAPTTAPTTRPGGGQARAMGEIMGDLQQVQMELAPVMSSPSVLSDPAVRDKAKEKALPVLKRLVGLMEEAAVAAPDPQMAEQLQAGRYQVQALLVGFGDAQAAAQLKAEDALDANVALSLGGFIAANDSEGKLRAVNELETLAEQHPESPAIAQTAVGMASLSEGDENVSAAAKAIVTNKLKGPAAEQSKQMLGDIEQAKEQEASFEAKFIDKPLTIEGQTLNGEKFSTEQWKGKVVMVDFWATWCGPCIAALPQVKDDYKQFHDQGFEIVAVSLDESAEPLKAFLAKNPEMTWPQIFTESDPKASSQIADKLGIQAIPTVFLLDRSGMVRAMAVGGGEQMDKLHKMIPELLKQQPTQEPAQPPQEDEPK